MSGASLPRLLTIMGSGETSPTMVKTHRALLDRLGPPPVLAVLLDTPYGFQENASDLTARTIGYFTESVGAPIELASYRSAEERGDALTYERTVERIARARYVFAGPGSPSYALAQWSESVVPALLADKLERGGAVTFASAAALTLGVVTVPVYEIYKVGARPEWLRGLDLLARAGLHAAVIPHYNNAEGGNHDTRFCYLGQRRLSMLEAALPEGAFVLGVDEHTGCVLDIDAGTATVVGLGVMTIRSAGRSEEVPAGESLAIGQIIHIAERLAVAPDGGSGTDAGAATRGGNGTRATTGSGTPTHGDDQPGPPGSGGRPEGRLARSPLLETVESRRAAFDQAVSEGDAEAAAREVLGLDDDLASWSADTLQSDERDRARSSLRAMILQLAELARTGLRDPSELVGPYIELVLDRRRAARHERRFAEADALRDGLVGLGVEVNDGPSGTRWSLRRDAGGASTPG